MSPKSFRHLRQVLKFDQAVGFSIINVFDLIINIRIRPFAPIICVVVYIVTRKRLNKKKVAFPAAKVIECALLEVAIFSPAVKSISSATTTARGM